MDRLKIGFAASEIVPFAKTGGLGDVAGALGKFLSHRHEVRMFMPLYDIVDTNRWDFSAVDFIRDVPIEMDHRVIYFTAVTARLPNSNADVYFIYCPELYHRGAVYTQDIDEYLRFAFFSRAVIECCQRMGFSPDIFHINDWQTALIPLYLKTIYDWDALFLNTKTLLTIHNVGYQGIFGADNIERIGLGDYYARFPREDIRGGSFSYLKTGFLYADMLSAVSETYAREIQTPEYGAGLDGLLRQRSSTLVGIVNGVDYEEWNPETDRYLPYRYSAQELSGKEKNKRSLLQQLGIPYDPRAPIYGLIARFTYQKGLDLLDRILFDFLARRDVRFLVLGGGEPKYESLFTAAQYYFPNKICYYRGMSEELAHRIEAGSDIFVMPSLYEPCGLNQIYSMKYGTVPIVRKTGGLADTVDPWNKKTGHGTGFVFEHFTADGLRWAMDLALETFHDNGAWHRLMLNGMAKNYSWELQVQKYEQVYEYLLR